jgi:hypothetical protein
MKKKRKTDIETGTAKRVGVQRPGSPFPGVLDDGANAPKNSDARRLDWLARHGVIRRLRVLKSGIQVRGIHQWQASVRAAIDADIETERRRMRAEGLNPQW